MSYVDVLKRLIEEKLDQAEDNLDWIAANGPEIIDAATTPRLLTVVRIPGLPNPLAPLANRAKEELAKAVAASRESLAVMRADLQFVGSPDNLRAAADAIDDDLITPSRELATQLVLGRIPSALDSNYSDGVASERYRAAIDGRDDAVRGIETYASPLSQALRDLADAIERFYLDMLGIVISIVGLVVSIVTLLVTWETGVGLVVGIVGLVISLGLLVLSGCDLGLSTMQAKDPVLDAFNSTIPPWPAVLS